jgi:enoyl-CoA hydratase/carnithine racemase
MNNYKHWQIAVDAAKITWLGLDRNEATVNSINIEVLDELNNVLHEIAQSNTTGLVIYSLKNKGFIAGADINVFLNFNDHKKTGIMEKVLELALSESLHKRIAYLKGEKIIPLAMYAKKHRSSLSALLNAAKRQTIPAFREKGVWKINDK